MATPHFRHLDRQRIAVDLDSGGRIVRFTGAAAYELLPGVGPVLRIHVAEAAGDFDLLISEEGWSGNIEECVQGDCRFRISLTSSDLCPRS